MKKTIKLYSVKVDKEIIDELTLIAYRYSKIKNYIYQNYGSINGLIYVDKPNNLSEKFKKEEIVLIMDNASFHKSKQLEIPKNIKIK